MFLLRSKLLFFFRPFPFPPFQSFLSVFVSYRYRFDVVVLRDSLGSCEEEGAGDDECASERRTREEEQESCC